MADVIEVKLVKDEADSPSDNDGSMKAEQLEQEHFRRIVNAFKHYRKHSLQRIQKSETYLSTLSERHQKLLKDYRRHFSKMRVSIDHNYEIIKLIIQDVSHLFENVRHDVDTSSECSEELEVLCSNKIHGGIQPTNVDMEKVQSTLKQFVRDWATEGKEERDACYRPIIDELKLRYPRDLWDRENISVLVPGAGLGRLAYEIAKEGFTCQGNEFSLFMLFASNFILNKCPGVNLLRLYPWIHQFCNNKNRDDQTRCVEFPDVNPSELPPDSQFSMAAGDFLEIYTAPGTWHSVATCFFIDTANNIVSYIETIWKILKPGGYWINIGPLLYHFADMPSENSIEPSYEDVRHIVKEVGFQILKEDTNLVTRYAQNPRSMLKYEYSSVFFVCQKLSIRATDTESNSDTHPPRPDLNVGVNGVDHL